MNPIDKKTQAKVNEFLKARNGKPNTAIGQARRTGKAYTPYEEPSQDFGNKGGFSVGLF
jgi:hypothetical protein